jgi:cytochrome c peroxidase
MNLKKILLVTGAAVLLSGLPATAKEISLEHGKKLFTSPGLGGSSNGKSCNSCHAGGAKLEKAGTNKQLSKAINRCTTGSLGGQKIDGRSAEMKSLKMYIASLPQK